MATFELDGALERVLAVLSSSADIVAERVHEARAPVWCNARGWSDFLLGLADRELEHCEANGLAALAHTLPGAPRSLLELSAEVAALSVLPTLDMPSIELENEEQRGVSRRKREQLSCLLGALAPLAAGARRIVDVGSGSGHFTRLAASHFERAALGLERSRERVESARMRVARREPTARAEYVVLELGRQSLRLAPDDLAVGLHACGELGDTLVAAVAASGANLALVSCCLQKISAPRRAALSVRARGLALPRAELGLSNLTSQRVGIESDIFDTMRARQARHSLFLLLRARGLELAPGAEMRGINRRRAHLGLSELASRALASRGLPPATDAEISEHEQRGALHFHATRRLSLPRNMLARMIELGVVLDRAACLQEAGYAVCLATLVERAITPRNLALFASHDSARLPRLQTESARADLGAPSKLDHGELKVPHAYSTRAMLGPP